MPDEKIDEMIKDWVKTLPAPLINNFSEQANIPELAENVAETLNPLLAESGYQAEVKLLSQNFNKIVRLKVERTAEFLDSEESVDDEFEEASYYCLSFENLEKYVEPDVSFELAAKREGEPILSHLAPIQAFNKTDKHRVTLLPFYQEGTLEDRISYARFFNPAADNSFDSDNYKALCGLRSLQNHYFKRHKDVRFTSEGMREASNLRVFSYESVNSAIHLYELAEKRAELLEMPRRSQSPLKRIRSALGRSGSKEVVAPTPDHQYERKHINDFFKFLLYSVDGAFLNREQAIELKANLEEHFPDKQDKGDFLANVRAALEDCNAIISDAINSFQFESNLEEIIETQQQALLDMSILVTELFADLEQAEVQYYDIKAPNFFVVDNSRLVITDNKSMAQRDKDAVPFGLGHMTYKSPLQEFSASDGQITVNTEWAKGLTKFQVGILLYEMTIGITGHHLFSNTAELLDAGVAKELDFNHPCFATPTGQVLKTQIQALTDLDPKRRPEFGQVREALLAFRQANEMVNQVQEEPEVHLPPAPLPLVCPADSPDEGYHQISIKEKIGAFREDEEIVVEDEQVKPK